MISRIKQAFGLWGTYLALIPFIVLIIYLLIAVSATSPGAVANTVSGWVGAKIAISVIAALVFAGLGIILGKNKSE